MRALLAALILTLLVPLSAHAQSAPTLPIAATLFPKGSDITWVASLGNRKIDCEWYMDCTMGVAPGFHSQNAESFNRQWGWAYEVTWSSTHHSAQWSIYVSTFPDAKSAQAVLDDFVSSIKVLNVPATTTPTMPTTAASFGITLVDGTQFYFLAFAVGDQEVEAATGYDGTDTFARGRARTSLVRSMRFLATSLCAASAGPCALKTATH